MADKKLESIKFPGLLDRYVVKPDIADVTGLQTALDGKADIEDVYNAFVTENLTGPIASFNDGADDIPVKSLVAEIVPVQSGSGDPSPHNVRAISGWTEANISVTGTNIWDEEWESGGIDPTDGSEYADVSVIRSKNYTSVLADTNYCFNTNGATILVFWYDANKTYIGYNQKSSPPTPPVITSPSNAKYLRFRMGTGYGTTYNHDISINYPSTDHDYHAYNGSTHTISWQSQAGTVYGGSIDVTTGVLTVTHKHLTFNGSEDWSNVGGSYPQAFQLYTGVLDCSQVQSARPNSLCNLFPTNISDVAQSGIRWATQPYTPNGLLYVYDETHSADLAGFKTMLSNTNLQFACPLITPQTYQLTPEQVKTLLGNNNIWADTGDVDVTYRADLKLYLDKVLNA